MVGWFFPTVASTRLVKLSSQTKIGLWAKVRRIKLLTRGQSRNYGLYSSNIISPPDIANDKLLQQFRYRIRHLALTASFLPVTDYNLNSWWHWHTATSMTKNKQNLNELLLCWWQHFQWIKVHKLGTLQERIVEIPTNNSQRIWLQYTHTFNGPLSGTTRVSRYQKGKINLDFTEARDSEWQWHQLGYMQVCISLQTDNHASTPPLSFFTGRMPFLPPNKQRQSTEGVNHPHM